MKYKLTVIIFLCLIVLLGVVGFVTREAVRTCSPATLDCTSKTVWFGKLYNAQIKTEDAQQSEDTQQGVSEDDISAYVKTIGAESIGGSRANTPAVTDQLFTASTKTAYILGHQYIYAQAALPQTITVRGHSITIEDIYEYPTNPKSKALPEPGSFKMVAETETAETLTLKRGGVYESIQVPLTKCDDAADAVVNNCDQFPSVSAGCDRYGNYLFWYIEEVDIDPETKEWNFIKVSLGLYQENFCQNVTAF